MTQNKISNESSYIDLINKYLIVSNLDESENDVLENYNDLKCGCIDDKNTDDVDASDELELSCIINIQENILK